MGGAVDHPCSAAPESGAPGEEDEEADEDTTSVSITEQDVALMEEYIEEWVSVFSHISPYACEHLWTEEGRSSTNDHG